jgi:CheY-like chemotaxis protein
MGNFKDLQVLLAEDNGINQRIASLIFTQMGMRFDLASNGKDAVELVKKKNYDIILMDIKMPVMNGLDATREIRAFERESAVEVPAYIVALTASEVLDSRNVCMEAGMDEFMEKPIKEPLLRELFFRVFD